MCARLQINEEIGGNPCFQYIHLTLKHFQNNFSLYYDVYFQMKLGIINLMTGDETSVFLKQFIC